MSDTTHRAAAGASAPALRLQKTMAAARVSFTWLGVRKTLSREQKEQAAESFGAEGQGPVVRLRPAAGEMNRAAGLALRLSFLTAGVSWLPPRRKPGLRTAHMREALPLKSDRTPFCCSSAFITRRRRGSLLRCLERRK